MDATLQGAAEPHRGLFAKGMRLVWAYIKLHPRPFLASVAGAVLFAVSSLLLTMALGRATDDVLKPAFSGGVAASKIWFAVLALMIFGCLRALGIMVRRYYSGVAGERVMATLRTDISDRYRDLALQYHRETPTGELLAHMEADVKAAVDLFWPVPFAIGVAAPGGSGPRATLPDRRLARPDRPRAVPHPRADEPGASRSGWRVRRGGRRRNRRRLGGRARVDRRSPGGEDARPRAGGDRAPGGAGGAAAPAAGGRRLHPRHLRGRARFPAHARHGGTPRRRRHAREHGRGHPR